MNIQTIYKEKSKGCKTFGFFVFRKLRFHARNDFILHFSRNLAENRAVAADAHDKIGMRTLVVALLDNGLPVGDIGLENRDFQLQTRPDV
ncbi:MAG: hypothetical protein J6D10_05945, partial [Clostridia bacterium]|nr:hypothetical protein [Clostridia bacterium]